MLKIRSVRTLITQKKKTFGAVYKCVCVCLESVRNSPSSFFATRHSVIFSRILFHQNVLQKLTHIRYDEPY